ncbi:MAG: septal ring lytic transglycosylase RlpA family protein [Segetibacter sp.]
MIFSCSPKTVETGRASYYADKFEGRKTSNGEIFSQDKMTAASKTLPFGTKVTVKNLTNGKTVKVRINDRGPFVAGRSIDLSKKAAKKIDMVDAGVADVELKYKNKKS